MIQNKEHRLFGSVWLLAPGQHAGCTPHAGVRSLNRFAVHAANTIESSMAKKKNNTSKTQADTQGQSAPHSFTFLLNGRCPNADIGGFQCMLSEELSLSYYEHYIELKSSVYELRRENIYLPFSSKNDRRHLIPASQL